MRAKHRSAKSKVLDFPSSDRLREAPRQSAPQMPAIAPAAVWSFLKKTRGDLSWTTERMIRTLKISAVEAGNALAALNLQGYIQPGGEEAEWITTPAGEEISGSKMARYTREKVDRALAEFAVRLKEANKDSKSAYKVKQVVAFGDFLSKQVRVQAPDVGVEVAERKQQNNHADIPNSELEVFLKVLKGKSSVLNVRRYESWMSERVHRKLF
jgi:hypothetical protein